MENQNIRALKNKHTGSDIWVIMAGSTMNYVDPSFFENKVTIGQNQVFKHFPCSYVVMKDCMEEPRFPRSIQACANKNIPLIFSRHYKGSRNKELNTPNHPNAYVFDHNPKESNLVAELASLEEDQIIVSKSTATSLMHVAAYMGAKNIILCGHDCGTLDDNLYYDDYLEKDWTSAGNWSGITTWMTTLEEESQLVRAFLMERYNCNVHSLNPFLNPGLESHKYVKI